MTNVPALTREVELRSLHDSFTVDNDGGRCLSGAKILALDEGQKVIQRLQESSVGQKERFNYLKKCLQLTYRLIRLAKIKL